MEPAEQHIREEILREGRVTFARFMELALFSVPGGYYSAPRTQPLYRDYFTSPTAHPLFGWLLAFQLEEVWQLLGQPDPFTVVEPGGGNGLLSRDILDSVQAMSGGFANALRYISVDRFGQEESLQRTPVGRPQRVIGDTLPFRDITGCVLSNELLDSFPVHRFQMHKGKLQEVYVTLNGDEMMEVLDESSTPELATRLESIAPSLLDGFHGEVCLALKPWVQQVAQSMKQGVILTIDYGGFPQELPAQYRQQGTLRCYYKHTVSGNPYIRIGRQDITTHVEFGTLIEMGEANGLTTLDYTTQCQFLRNLGAEAFLKALVFMRMPHHQLVANRLAMAELLRPDGLGGFKVLAQGKGTGRLKLSGFQAESALRQQLLDDAQTLQVPLLSSEHAPLLESRYPHEAWDFSKLWPWGQEE